MVITMKTRFVRLFGLLCILSLVFALSACTAQAKDADTGATAEAGSIYDYVLVEEGRSLSFGGYKYGETLDEILERMGISKDDVREMYMNDYYLPALTFKETGSEEWVPHLVFYKDGRLLRATLELHFFETEADEALQIVDEIRSHYLEEFTETLFLNEYGDKIPVNGKEIPSHTEWIPTDSAYTGLGIDVTTQPGADIPEADVETLVNFDISIMFAR